MWRLLRGSTRPLHPHRAWVLHHTILQMGRLRSRKVLHPGSGGIRMHDRSFRLQSPCAWASPSVSKGWESAIILAILGRVRISHMSSVPVAMTCCPEGKGGPQGRGQHSTGVSAELQLLRTWDRDMEGLVLKASLTQATLLMLQNIIRKV